MNRLFTAGIISYLLAAGVSFFAFRTMAAPSTPIDIQPPTADEGGGTLLGQLLQINPTEPADQVCPLNGKFYTTTEKSAWEKRRPLAVMIENTEDARPQSGLSYSDLVFEAVAEGGITRYMAFFYCGAQRADVTLAPIRSARTYFIDWASGFNLPMYVHVGGANLPGPADALGQINDYGWALQNDMNQFSIGYPTFVRNANRLGREVATEHTMETTTERLWKVAEKRGWTNMSPDRKVAGKTVVGSDWKEGYTGWTFADGKPGSGTTNDISYEFWSGYSAFAVAWKYDPATNTYKRVLGGQPHTDLNNNEQVAASNVIVLLTDEKGPIDEAKHMLYTTTGTGKALVFNNGMVTEVKWSKPKRESELEFLDAKGKAVELVRGLTWISVLDKANTVTY